MLAPFDHAAIAVALEHVHATGRARCDRPPGTSAELGDARRSKARWGVNVTMRLDGMGGREAAMAFVEAGAFPLDRDAPNHHSEARHLREVVLARVMHLEQLIGPHP